MRTGSSAVLAGICALVVSSAADAQVLQPPPRPVRGLFGGGRPPDPTRTRQELTLSGNLLGGYDDNLAPPDVAGDPFVPHPSGYMAFAETTLRYWLGRQAKSIEVSGRGFMNTYRNIGLGPSYGGELMARAVTNVGRRSQIEAHHNLRYDPFFSLGAFGSLHDVNVSNGPDSNPTNTLTESRSWATDTAAAFNRQWTPRLRSDVGYALTTRHYVEGVGFDSRSDAASVGLDRSVGRAGSLRVGYRYVDNAFTLQDGSSRPLLSHTADFGYSYRRSVSRTRSMSMSGGAGAMHVDTVEMVTRAPLNYWAPSGYGTIRVDVGRSWSVAADYRRSLSVLEGVRPESFVTDAAIFSVGGFLGPRVETVFSAAYSNGQSGVQPVGDQRGSYEGYTGTAQVRFLLMRGWTSVVSFNHYEYNLNNAAREAIGVSPSLNRNAVRIGFTWSLPLYGAYVTPPPPPSGRD